MHIKVIHHIFHVEFVTSLFTYIPFLCAKIKPSIKVDFNKYIFSRSETTHLDNFLSPTRGNLRPRPIIINKSFTNFVFIKNYSRLSSVLGDPQRGYAKIEPMPCEFICRIEVCEIRFPISNYQDILLIKKGSKMKAI